MATDKIYPRSGDTQIGYLNSVIESAAVVAGSVDMAGSRRKTSASISPIMGKPPTASLSRLKMVKNICSAAKMLPEWSMQ